MEIVEQLSTLKWYPSFMGGRLGPFWSANKVERRIADVWHTIVEEALRALTLVSDHPPLTFQAPSAEHAAIFLKTVQILVDYDIHRNPKMAEGLASAVLKVRKKEAEL
jgi:hypothetical protein